MLSWCASTPMDLDARGIRDPDGNLVPLNGVRLTGTALR